MQATRTLLVSSSEPEDDPLLKDRLFTFAREDNSFNLKHQEKLEHENSIKRHVQFCELNDANVLAGNCYYFNTSKYSQNLFLFKISQAHQIGLKLRIKVYEPFYLFDATVIANRTLVALAHCTDISLSEIKNIQFSDLALNQIYRLSINNPTQVLWCGGCLFTGTQENSQRLSAISISDYQLKITTYVQVPHTSSVFASKEHLVFVSGEKGILFCSIEEVPLFNPTPPPISYS